MQRRIYGLETEFGIIWTPDEGRAKRLTVQNTVMYLFREIVAGRNYPDVFLENGARFYQDIGCHPEYATPECDDVAELVAHDKAGERIITRLASTAERRMRNDGFRGKISIFKNNLDTSGNTYGCHENYLMERHINFRQLAAQLIPFFVTRQIFAGAGKIKLNYRQFTGKSSARALSEIYAISQRAEHIREEISIATTTARGIINTRDEPHADREKYRRLHVIVGDSNMSEFSTFLKVGTTGIVLRMIEDNFIRKPFTLRKPVEAIRQISDDTTCTRQVEMENGKRLSAVELQWEYLECAKRYLEQADSDPTTEQVMARWEYVLTCLEKDPMQLEREVDWVIKWKWLQTYAAKRSLKWHSPEIRLLDLKYHNVRPESSLYYTLEDRDELERIVDNEQIRHAEHYPPKGTRAKFRGKFIKKINEGKMLGGVNWSYIHIYEPHQILYLSEDPFKPEFDEASRMVYSI
ncbi:Pup--protein ligase [Candidatus Poribacteria bacterium]|nr:MAG: Pup--protein ligase [Candidatus Poribacteria bacterium]